MDQLGEAGRQCGSQSGDVGGIALQARERGVGVVLAEERDAAGKALVEDQAQGVEISPSVEALAAHLLGREVLRRAHHDVVVGEVVVARLEALGDPEVGEQHSAVGGDEDVARLHVAVHHSCLVGRIERTGNARADVDRELGAELLLLVEQLTQALAVDELHHDGLTAVVLDRVVHRHDVRMVQLGDGDRLTTESFGHDGIGREIGFQQLDRHLARERQVGAEPHLGHASLREPTLQAISLGKDCRRQRWGAGGRGHVRS